MVESDETQVVHVMKSKCDERVVVGVLRARLGRFQNLNACSESGNDPTMALWTDVAAV